MTDDVIPDALISSLSAGKVILFAGSGLSATAGIPLWANVTHRLIQLALGRGAIDSDSAIELKAQTDLREVADHLLPLLTDPEKAAFFREEFSSEDQSVPHQILSDVGIRRVITTNWDCMAERMIEPFASSHDPSRPWQNSRTTSFCGCDSDRALIDAARKSELSSWVFHIHGIYYRPDTVVWDTNSFADVLDNDYVSAFFADLLRDNAVLYVGYSMEDSDFRQLTERIFRKHRASMERHYAIVANVSNTRRQTLAKKGITAISYSTGDSTPTAEEHDYGLTRLLSRMAEMRPNVRGPNWVSGRSNDAIHNRMTQLLNLGSTADSTPGIRIYGSAGRDFLRDHEDSIYALLERGIGVDLILLDPRVQISLPGSSDLIGIHDWRDNGVPSGVAHDSSEYAEFIEAHLILTRIKQKAAASGISADGLEVRYSSIFPRNTICQIGWSIFDCPRPLRKLSLQGPMFEYRHGSIEYSYFAEAFDTLWGLAVQLDSSTFPRWGESDN
ncbi:SIR2 family protein [Nocardia beijingensis]|uniref:SIR2 family protein n=1 Tax=Nocardia beijingensis TaxID=95162 RepID=A0ABW7W8T3_9NOCA